MKIYNCKTEHRINPVGIDAEHPRFSWNIESEYNGTIQQSYQIWVSDTDDMKNIVWDSGEIKSEECLYIPYQGLELKSLHRYYWKVRVTTDKGVIESNTDNNFEMGILNKNEWKAKWIEPELDINEKEFKPAQYLRKCFKVEKTVLRARIYQSAHGMYEFWVNGKIGTDEVYKPGFTSYYKRIQYQVYDITSLVRKGENVWSVVLGDGWWRGITGGVLQNNFGYKVAYIGQILLEYTDGSTEWIVSDKSFKTNNGGWLETDMRRGEVYDASKEPEGWKEVGFNDNEWTNALEAEEKNTLETLIPSRSVPVKEHEKFIGKVFKDVNQDWVIDFGQNIAGIVKIKLHNCKKGEIIRIDHAEAMLDGKFSFKNLMFLGNESVGEFQRVIYITAGKEEEIFVPRFSFFGFRYIRITGYNGNIEPEDFVAYAMYSDLQETGRFKCSNVLINKLVENCSWSQKGNYLDVPTDCPTRERSAWTGDSQIYCETSTRFMDVYPFMEKWMLDFNCEQFSNGLIPSTIPNTVSPHQPEEIEKHNASVDRDSFEATLPGHMYTDPEYGAEFCDGSSGWGDAAVINPYVIYERYGDKQILINQYMSAKRWVDYIIYQAKKENPLHKDKSYYYSYTNGTRDADYIWDGDFQYGEWLEPDVNVFVIPNFFKNRKREGCPQVATAYLGHSAHLLSMMAEVLEKKEDAVYYAEYSRRVKSVYSKFFIDENGIIAEGRQAENVRALKFHLYDKSNKKKVVDYLVDTIKSCGDHLNTGFLSTGYLLEVLYETGNKDLAFKLLEQESSPSWLYSVKEGATTILEDWEGYDTHSGSFNHYSKGSVVEFLFGVVGGIKPDFNKPGYKHFYLKPEIGGTLQYADTEFESPYGKIESHWKINGDKIDYQFVIPANTTATVILYADNKEKRVELKSGSYQMSTERVECR